MMKRPEKGAVRVNSALTTIRKILAILSPAERRRGLILLGLVFLMAILQTAGVASVMPFLALLGNQELVLTNDVLSEIYEFSGFQSVNGFVFALGVFSFAVLVIGSTFRAVVHYALHHYTRLRMHSVSMRLLSTYLKRPYAFMLNRHSGDLAKSILSEADLFSTKVLKPGLHLIAHLFVAMSLVVFLFIVDPVLASIIAAVVGFSYLGVFLSIRGVLHRMGRDRVSADRERFKATAEAFGGIKDLKLLGREEFFLNQFRSPSRRNARALAMTETIAEVPRYLIEAIGFGGVLLLALYLQSTRANLGEVLPILGMYALAGYRLLPAAQQIYHGSTKLRFATAIVDSLHSELHTGGSIVPETEGAPPLVPSRDIVLESVRYAYPGAARATLEGVDMSIRVGETVGLVGPSGAGKTTLVDVLLGLLRPNTGQLVVDDRIITDGLVRSWQSSIGYVPQNIFLWDASVAENIALGVPRDEIDPEAVERAARLAMIHDFITGELEQGYETAIGERGVRISGGQRQRLGLARALYHDPAVLVLDEATSALDTETERSVMEAISALHSQKTIVIIAHRASTLTRCDRVYRLEGGCVQEETPHLSPRPEGANGSWAATEAPALRVAGLHMDG